GTDSVGILDILMYQFTAVRVVQVSAVIGGALDLRLVATVPSRDVIGTLVSSLQWSLFRPIVAMLGVCIVVIVAVALVFRELTVVEKDILQMANVFEGHPITAKQDAREEDSSRESGASQTRRRLIPVVFKEISAITAAVNTLTRELYTLKAFTTIGCNPPQISPGDTTTIASEVSSQPISRFTEDIGGIPYQFLGDKIWRVPVTTVYGALARDLVDPDDDPVAVYKIHNAVLTTIQKYALKFTGASVDHFFGDHFLVHFNASARTPKHVLVGLSVVVETVKGLKATFVSSTKKLTATVSTPLTEGPG
ncbi:transmembrane protein, putative, partial [Bodo saltans]